jgi:hypothetical protein
MAKSDPVKDPEYKGVGDVATRIMERMVRMPPKQHKDMKLGRKAKQESGKPSPRHASQEKADEPSDGQ